MRDTPEALKAEQNSRVIEKSVGLTNDLAILAWWSTETTSTVEITAVQVQVRL